MPRPGVWARTCSGPAKGRFKWTTQSAARSAACWTPDHPGTRHHAESTRHRAGHRKALREGSIRTPPRRYMPFPAGIFSLWPARTMFGLDRRLCSCSIVEGTSNLSAIL